MSSYPNTLITNAGLDLIAEANAQGEALIFTKVKLGDGSLPEGQSIQTMAALISPKLESELTSGSVKNGQAKLRFSVENSGLDEGFFAREVGVFAKVGEEGTETLYAYTNGGNYVDYIPNKDVPIDAQIMDVYIVTGNAATVQIQVDSAAYATVLDLEEHNTGSDSHADLLHLRKPSTAYAVGDIAYSPQLPSWAYLECTVGGTTDSGDLPVPSSVVGGDTITDGTVEWTVKKVGDSDLTEYTTTVNSPMFNKRDVITTSGTYTAPVTGWYKITVKGAGGGGSNGFQGSAGYYSGNGGGEGGTTIAYVSMTVGDNATVVIGGGGSLSDGGDSSVIIDGNTYTGGGGKFNGQGGSGTLPGCPGGGSTGNGSSNYTNAVSGGGAGGACTGSLPVANSGGGGAGGGIGATNRTDGADGFVWFEYFDSTLNP